MKFLEILIGTRHPSSRDQAKERLKLVLVNDRTDMTPAMLQTLKDELIAVVSKHLDIDPERVHISIGEGNQRDRLVAEIPMLPAGRTRRTQTP
jgi:cell division topological specificity factor